MCGRRDAMQLEPPEGGSAAEPRLGGLCQLVSAVGREAKERFFAPSLQRKFPIAPASLMLTLGALNMADGLRQKRQSEVFAGGQVRRWQSTADPILAR